MKKGLVLILTLLVSYLSYSQNCDKPGNYCIQWKRGIFDSLLKVPDFQDTTRRASFAGNGDLMYITGTGSTPKGFYGLENGNYSLLGSNLAAKQWTVVDVPDSNRWVANAYGNGTWVVIGLDTGVSTEQFMVSNDGFNWRMVNVPCGFYYDICFGKGMFVAVSRGCTSKIITSVDGINWTTRELSTPTDNLQTVTYGDGMFVALSAFGADAFYTSIDGISWSRGTAFTGHWRDVEYANGKYIGVSSGGDNYIMISEDARNWSLIAPPDSGSWWDATYGKGRWLIVCSSCDDISFIYSDDNGDTWQADTITDGITRDWSNVLYAEGYFVATAYSSADSTQVMRSPTAQPGSWELLHNMGDSTNGWHHIKYGNGIYMATSVRGKVMVSGVPILTEDVAYGLYREDSIDLVSTKTDNPSTGYYWTVSDAVEANFWRACTYGNGRFVAVARTGTNRIMWSQNGRNWNLSSATEANNWEDVTFGNGVFVACARSGTNRIMRSLDGITWTAITSPIALELMCIAYGNGKFVILGNGSQGLVSTDGITWTATTTPSWIPRSVTYGNGLFVGVGGSGDDVITSPDGITWTSRTAPITSGWQDVTYGNAGFVAVCFSCATNRIMSSPDGITWTGTTSFNDYGLQGVAYGNGYYIAVAYSTSASTSRIIKSSDAATWELIPNASGNVNGWYNPIYGNGVWVITGDNNKVMNAGRMWELEKLVTYSRPDVTDTFSTSTKTFSSEFSDYIFLGTTTTVTLPQIAGYKNVSFYVKNRGSGNMTVNSVAGGNDIYDASAVNTITIPAGEARILVNDGQYWNVE